MSIFHSFTFGVKKRKNVPADRKYNIKTNKQINKRTLVINMFGISENLYDLNLARVI